jgi:tripartite ATP-independent transporter DctM subunit
MEVQILVLVVSFLALLLLNVPVAVAIGLCTLILMMSMTGVDTTLVMAQRMSSANSSFTLLAIPFFIAAGILMGEGGMSRRLINLATLLAGRFQGGLAYVSTLTCMMFGAISGSATAAVSSIGGIMIPAMERRGFNRDYSVAVTTTAATTGLLIPPSNVMIVFAVVSGNVSVAAMFMAGLLPGILVGFLLLLACWLTIGRALRSGNTGTVDHAELTGRNESSSLVSMESQEGTTAAANCQSPLRIVLAALPSMLLIVIVLAGILGGFFSATEASAIAVLYAFVMSVILYREVKLTDLPSICLRTGVMTSVVFLLISTSQAMSWALASQQIPQTLANLMLGISDNPVVILLLINLALLFVGTFMDMTPAVLIFTPIFLPVVEELGMHPVHFGVMMVANLCIGLCTPPVGTCLFVGCSVGKTSIASVTKSMMPFFLAMLIALLVTTYWPAITMWLPQLLDLV